MTIFASFIRIVKIKFENVLLRARTRPTGSDLLELWLSVAAVPLAALKWVLIAEDAP
jgi:hypothetical protein